MITNINEWDCPGEGKCHGCLKWCDHCGNVASTCNYATCLAHNCVTCKGKGSMIDGQCYACKLDAEILYETERFEKILEGCAFGDADKSAARIVFFKNERRSL